VYKVYRLASKDLGFAGILTGLGIYEVHRLADKDKTFPRLGIKEPDRNVCGHRPREPGHNRSPASPFLSSSLHTLLRPCVRTAHLLHEFIQSPQKFPAVVELHSHRCNTPSKNTFAPASLFFRPAVFETFPLWRQAHPGLFVACFLEKDNIKLPFNPKPTIRSSSSSSSGPAIS
jgi:hypothetical protein